ncbi:monooxygenase [Paramyrothecium foliicola]|nr:monooxygenase [Paramyrothecium foliicola]
MAISKPVLDKYAAEREQRLRLDNYSASSTESFSLQYGAQIKVLIGGGGMFGLMAAHHLIHAGGTENADLVIVDKAGGFGGRWYWNRYPGVACDIESYCYVPLLEETGYKPRHRYFYGYEIREQLEIIARQSKIQGQFLISITYQKWCDDSKRWIVTLSRDVGPGCNPEELTVHAQFLILAGGIQTSPHVPKLNGLDVFRSAADKILIHPGRWDWNLTGGSQDKPDLVNLRNKRVGIIGTEATTRTPSYVGPQSQKEAIAEDWERIACKPGWQYERVENLDAIFTGKPGAEDKFQDGWTKVVTDKAIAEKLKPWYPGFCKRPAFHASYLPLFNEPTVSLIDTNGQGIEAYTPNGVMANGREYELDVIVLATGYTVGVVDSHPLSMLPWKGVRVAC